MPADRPASPAQLKFIRSLLTARPAVLAQYGFTTVDDVINSLAANAAFTTRAASGMIDQLKAIPAEAVTVAGVALPAGARPNRYAGKCGNCKATVPAEAGYFVRDGANKVVVFHTTCPTPATQAAPAPVPADLENGLYTDGSDTWKLYTTQNGRQACKVLRGRTFQYVVGGVRRVREGVAAGTIRVLTQAEAAAFGRLHGFCINCGRDIDDDRSLAAGYGPVCAERFGWWYPTYEEAADVLGRPVVKPSGVVVTPAATSTPADDSHAAHAPTAADPVTLDEVFAVTCPDCGGVLVNVIGEPCLARTPDYRGQYPIHS